MKKISCFLLFILTFYVYSLVSFAENKDNLTTNVKKNSNINVSTKIKDQKNISNTKNSDTNKKIINTDNNKKNDTTTKENHDKNVLNNDKKENSEKKENEEKQEDKVKKKQNYHIVAESENIYRIALKYGTTQQEIIKLNNLNNGNIYVGQKLLLPDNIKEDDEQIKKNENKNTVIDMSEQKNENNNTVDKLDPTTFVWPARGIILSKFGYKTKTGRLEGVNIGVENGSVVKASSSGVIVYNDTVEGYDNVIIIRHYNGFFTAYGYTEPLVAVGDNIKKGQVIAHVAKDKQSKRSKLYFTIRKNGKSYDPEKIIQTKISD